MISLIKQKTLDNARLILPAVADYTAKYNRVVNNFNKGFTTKNEFEAQRKELRVERAREEMKLIGRWASENEMHAALSLLLTDKSDEDIVKYMY